MPNLNDEQRRAVEYAEGNLVVTASPGSGKTRTLVARAKHLHQKLNKHKQLALITYTNAASDEISHRLGNKKNVFVGTIHRFCLEYILRPYGWKYGWNKPRVVNYQEQLDFIESKTYFTDRFIPTDLSFIKKTLDGQFDSSVTLWNHNSSTEEIAVDFHNYLEEIKAIDFSEILYRSYKLVTENRFIAEYLAHLFDEILVDEFQDTDLFQYEILKTINEVQDCNFFMVGDSRQRIFGFAGAIRNAFEKAIDDFSANEIVLTKVYRSSNEIVSYYTKLYEDHPVLTNESEFKNFDFPVEVRSSASLSNTINELIDTHGVNEENIAILCQSWFDNFEISTDLRRSYNIVGIGSLPHRFREFNNSTMHLLRALSYHKFRNSNFSRIILKRHIETYCQENDLVSNDLNYLNFKSIELATDFNSIDCELSLQDGLSQIKNLFFQSFSKEHHFFDDIVETINVNELEYWNFERYIKVLAGVGGIFNDTYHKAKGLEFEAVILYAVNETKLPYYNPKFTENPSLEQVEDSRKLLYVGLSRAKKYLYILCHDDIGQSRYLDEIRSRL